MAELRLHIVSVPVSDQANALEFYRDRVGLPVIADERFEREPGVPARWVQLAAGPATITLVTWFPTMAPGSVKGLVLETSDLDAAVADLASRGVPIAHPVMEAPWARFTSFDDPDGNGWVLQESRRAGA